MDRYMIGFLILVGWFVCFKMFPSRLGEYDQSFCGTVDNEPTETTPFAGSNRFKGDVAKGKLAFQANCARCHNSALEKKSTGPALLGVGSRIPEGDWIYNWVRNSSKVIQSGDEYAVKIWEANNKASMDPFPNLPKETINDIMAWIDGH